jgi:hypothetical protein
MEAFIPFALVLVSKFWADMLFDTKLLNNGSCKYLYVDAGYYIHY